MVAHLAIGPAHGAYLQVIDAVTGTTLYRHDLVSADRGDALVVRNYPGARLGGKPQTVNVIQRHWLPPAAQWLNGRNAIAWADLNADDVVQANEKTPVPGTRRGAQFAIKSFDSAPGCGPRGLADGDSPLPLRT